ncbi:tryptophanyl-tRNA synthetase [Emticicia oligotrophica DSM 17448]|uniref:Tryptophan--tRNA ligase n=1 Tax=Emticicia oligotrophica (strain DSM 17448 / CIP 109782 / MTCC 6937 / GPTSA100-15) TaxID=929562 RepID=A0ABM5N6K4_EMTOG|nr:tryptophan--tRNA ligase [Emticicia oligotrophica]AFK05174.1 tryptophanyl-tRNA synthetase [Emticicia oligotrophica DSM 17448]
MARILTGIQASGCPHLGNILGAILPAIKLSQNPANESFLFIADLHSMTTIKDAKVMQENTRAVAAAWLACGFDADKNYFYRQSRLAGYHTELMWYLNCQTPYPMLANAHSFKDKSDRLADVNAGLFTYPVLQAADIVLYGANLVPVGKDQRQHLEMSKDIAASFNRTYGEVLVLPEPLIDENVMVIPGTDGTKMSKSYNNFINIFLDEKPLLKSIKAIISDSTPLEEPKNPETDVTFKLFSLVAEPEQVEDMRQKYLAGGFGYGHAKQMLFEVLWKKFQKEREIFNYYMSNSEALDAKLVEGEAKAREIAEATMNNVRNVLGYL